MTSVNYQCVRFRPLNQKRQTAKSIILRFGKLLLKICLLEFRAQWFSCVPKLHFILGLEQRRTLTREMADNFLIPNLRSFYGVGTFQSTCNKSFKNIICVGFVHCTCIMHHCTGGGGLREFKVVCLYCNSLQKINSLNDFSICSFLLHVCASIIIVFVYLVCL